MNYAKMGVDFLGIIFELYIIVLLFDHIWQRKENCRRIPFYIAYIVVMCIKTVVSMSGWGNFLVALMASVLLAWMYEGKRITRIFYSILINVGFFLAEMVVGLMLMIALGGSIEDHLDNLSFYTCGVFFSNFLLYIVIKVVILREDGKINTSMMNRMPLLIVLPIATGYVMLVVEKLVHKNQSQFMSLLTAGVVIILIVADIFIFVFSERMLLQEMKLQRLSFAEEQMKQQAEHYRKMVENQREIAKIKHDMNNYLISLSGYISNDQSELALKKIEEQVQTLSSGDTVKCNNYCVEALLNGKDKIIKRDKIKVDYKLDLPSQLKQDEMDVCIILGNLLDNALEACSKFENDEEKWIEVSVGLKQELLAVVVRNPVCKGYEPLKGNKTIKAEKKAHGYGLDNVRMMAEKYNGSADFIFENYVFTSSVLLRNK